MRRVLAWFSIERGTMRRILACFPYERRAMRRILASQVGEGGRLPTYPPWYHLGMYTLVYAVLPGTLFSFRPE